jgi:hypothetical protein
MSRVPTHLVWPAVWALAVVAALALSELRNPVGPSVMFALGEPVRSFPVIAESLGIPGTVDVAMSVPRALQVGETGRVELVLSRKFLASDAALFQLHTPDGSLRTMKAVAGKRLRVTLEGSEVLITPLTPLDRLFLAEDPPAHWEWDVSSNRAGVHHLVMNVATMTSESGAETLPRNIISLLAEMTVSQSWYMALWRSARRNARWILISALVPIALVFLQARLRRTVIENRSR